MLDAAARYKDEYAAGITPEERASRKAAGDRLSAAWDYRAMARAILGGHWKTMKPAERKEYLALLPSMIRKYRYPQMSENLNGALDIKILGERGLKSAGTAVRTRVIHKNAGISVSPELYLRRTNTGWVIYDIRSDGESLFLIYREMHKTIIKENGVSALLNAMKQKL
jgi:ABC-type transporter MlaC component